MRNILFYLLLILIFGAWLFVLNLYFDTFDFGLIFLALVGAVWSVLMIAAIKGIFWRIDNGVDLLATLHTNPEKVKEDMLRIMHYGHDKGIEGALEEFSDIFRNYPQWEFQKWEVFRSWYKDLIDHALENPHIYVLTMKDGSPYEKEKDNLYDPEAPEWEQFDIERTYYDDDDDDDNDIFDENSNKGSSGTNPILVGMGIGLGIGISSSPSGSSS